MLRAIRHRQREMSRSGRGVKGILGTWMMIGWLPEVYGWIVVNEKHIK
jgi:hypothetical protein